MRDYSPDGAPSVLIYGSSKENLDTLRSAVHPAGTFVVMTYNTKVLGIDQLDCLEGFSEIRLHTGDCVPGGHPLLAHDPLVEKRVTALEDSVVYDDTELRDRIEVLEAQLVSLLEQRPVSDGNQGAGGAAATVPPTPPATDGNQG